MEEEIFCGEKEKRSERWGKEKLGKAMVRKKG